MNNTLTVKLFTDDYNIISENTESYVDFTFTNGEVLTIDLILTAVDPCTINSGIWVRTDEYPLAATLESILPDDGIAVTMEFIYTV
jgi:hypothetical protein